jgi:hypothetical protein
VLPLYFSVRNAHCAVNGASPRRLSCEGHGAFFYAPRLPVYAALWQENGGPADFGRVWCILCALRGSVKAALRAHRNFCRCHWLAAITEGE